MNFLEPGDATVTTLAKFPTATEGLTGDDYGNFYTAARNPGLGQDCPVYRVHIEDPVVEIVGYVPRPSDTVQCSGAGLAFDYEGSLYIGSLDKVYVLEPNVENPPTATVFATNTPLSNGLAFDRSGNLWVSEGPRGWGSVYRVPAEGGVGVEMFRIQSMTNSVNTGGKVSYLDGVGRQTRSFPLGTLTNAPALGAIPIVSNGIAFDARGDTLYVADSARSAIWKVEFNRHGAPKIKTGCDPTFSDNTLCQSHIMIAHPILDGIDGIVLDKLGNIWASANVTNSIVAVTKIGHNVVEVFRNPVNGSTLLRNAGDQSVGNDHILEFPASPYIMGRRFCTSNFDIDNRDNSPNSGGELNQAAGPFRGKISCIDQELLIPGLALPLD